MCEIARGSNADEGEAPAQDLVTQFDYKEDGRLGIAYNSDGSEVEYVYQGAGSDPAEEEDRLRNRALRQ